MICQKKNNEEDVLEYLSDELLQESQKDFTKHKNIKEREINLTTGPLSFHWKRRIEISKKIAKNFGINYEFPLANRELMEFFHSLPSHYKYRNGKNRLLMRTFLENNLCKKIAWRRDKAGSTSPAGRYYLIRNLPKTFLERVPNNYQGVLDRYLNISKIRSRLEKGPCSSSTILRTLIAALMIHHLEKKS